MEEKEAKHEIYKEEERKNMQNQEKESNIKAAMEEADVDQGACFSHLPLDITSLIAKDLILTDYLHFRASCRTFQSAAPPIRWKKNWIVENYSRSPWLMFLEKDNVCTFIDPKHGEKYLIKLPQLLSGCEICYSKDGWFLMTRKSDSTFYVNPFTMEILQLPKRCYKFGLYTKCIGFSSTPISSECTLVRICKRIHNLNVDFARLGDEKWHKVNTIHDHSDFQFYNNSPVFYNGAFYYLGQDGNLGVLQLVGGNVTWNVLPKPEPPCSNYHQNYLVECDGELLSVFVGKCGRWVRVFKLNRTRMTWNRLDSLGNYTLYVSRSSSFSAVAETPGMENKIYFPRFHGQSIVFYSLYTNKYHSFESKNLPINICSTREKIHCVWIEPRGC